LPYCKKVLYSKDSTTGENMNDHLKEWAEERAIKQTKLPQKTWIKQPDGTSRALVELVRDKDGCVVRIEPAPLKVLTKKTTAEWKLLLENRFGLGSLSQRDIDIAVEVERMVNFAYGITKGQE
jgi:hypothetical protein